MFKRPFKWPSLLVVPSCILFLVYFFPLPPWLILLFQSPTYLSYLKKYNFYVCYFLLCVYTDDCAGIVVVSKLEIYICYITTISIHNYFPSLGGLSLLPRVQSFLLVLHYLLTGLVICSSYVFNFLE